jgi:hypothetical protein
MKMESSLSILNLDGQHVPMLAFDFVDDAGAKCVVDFEPNRVLLSESTDKGYYDLVDTEGFKYARVKHSAEWIDAAMDLGLFVLSMRTPLPQTDRVGGRVMMVAFPFGTVIKDSGTFSANTKDLSKLETVKGVAEKIKANAAEAFKSLREGTRKPD